jgi:hypothetical protein
MNNITLTLSVVEELEMVNKCGLDLEKIDIQSTAVCIAAVKQDGRALCHVHYQTLEICLSAVKQNDGALRYVRGQFYQECAKFLNR